MEQAQQAIQKAGLTPEALREYRKARRESQLCFWSRFGVTQSRGSRFEIPKTKLWSIFNTSTGSRCTQHVPHQLSRHAHTSGNSPLAGMLTKLRAKKFSITSSKVCLPIRLARSQGRDNGLQFPATISVSSTNFPGAVRVLASRYN